MQRRWHIIRVWSMCINCWLHKKKGKKANPSMFLGLLILYIQQVGRMWVTGCTNLGEEAKFSICTLLQFSVTTSLLKDRLLQRMSCGGMIITTQPCQLHSILRKFYSNSYLVPFERANLQEILITKTDLRLNCTFVLLLELVVVLLLGIRYLTLYLHCLQLHFSKIN